MDSEVGFGDECIRRTKKKKKTDTILNRNPRMASSYIELRVWYDRYKRYTVYEIRYRILYILFVLQSRHTKKSSIIYSKL